MDIAHALILIRCFLICFEYSDIWTSIVSHNLSLRANKMGRNNDAELQVIAGHVCTMLEILESPA